LDLDGIYDAFKFKPRLSQKSQIRWHIAKKSGYLTLPILLIQQIAVVLSTLSKILLPTKSFA